MYFFSRYFHIFKENTLRNYRKKIMELPKWLKRSGHCVTQQSKVSVFHQETNPEKYRSSDLAKWRPWTRVVLLRAVALDFLKSRNTWTLPRKIYTKMWCHMTIRWSCWGFSSFARCSLLFGTRERALGSCDG